jgi:hypothetical protein
MPPTRRVALSLSLLAIGAPAAGPRLGQAPYAPTSAFCASPAPTGSTSRVAPRGDGWSTGGSEEGEAAVGNCLALQSPPGDGPLRHQVGDRRDHDRGFADPAGDDPSGLPGIANRLACHWGRTVGGDIGGKVAAALAMAAIRSPEPLRISLVEQAQEWV